MPNFLPGLTRCLLVGLFSLVALAPTYTIAAQAQKVPTLQLAKKSSFRGDVILVRGGFDVFSRGMDQMADKLVKKGVDAKVFKHTQANEIAARIIKNQKKFGRKPIVLIGHSWGANAIIRVAKVLKKKRMRVTYMATFAATDPETAPNNISKLTNYYFKKDGWGKPVKTVKGFRGRLKNIDMSKNPDVHHFNVEEQPRLQNQVIRNVLRFVKPKRRG